MKFFLPAILFLNSLQCSHVSNNCVEKLLKKIHDQEIISKNELQDCLSYNFTNYKEKFIGHGSLLSSGIFSIGIIRGIKDTIIYDILIVFKNSNPVLIRENSRESFYRKDGTINSVYGLGETYSTYNGSDTTCLKVYFKKIIPFRMDTLPYKFRPDMGTIVSLDSLTFCN